MTRCMLIVLLFFSVTSSAQDTVTLGRAISNAEAFAKQGRHAEALQQYEVARQAAERVFGPQHRNVAVINGEAGNLLRGIGEPAKAKPMLAAALRIYEQGADAKLIAEGLNNLAAACVELGEYSEARALHERGLAQMTKAYGAESQETAASLGNLAGVFQAEGRYDDAEALYRKQIATLAAVRLKPLTEKASRTAAERHAHGLMNLANIYLDRLDFVRAEPLYLASIKMLEGLYGAKHFEVARVRNNLAVLYTSASQYDRAEAEQRFVLGVLETSLGKDGIDAARSKSNLATLMVRKKNFAEAERLYREVLAVREQKLGAEHPDVALTLSTLGLLYTETSRYDEARAVLNRGLEMRRKIFGADSTALAESLAPLAAVALREKKLDEAERLLGNTRAIETAGLPAGHPNFANTHRMFGLLRIAQDRPSDAVREFDAARRTARDYVRQSLPALSDGDQIRYLREVDEPSLHSSVGIVIGREQDREVVERSAEWVLNGKGMASEAVARRVLLARDATGPQAKVAEELTKVRKELAALWYSAKLTANERKARGDELSRREAELVKQLTGSKAVETAPWVDLVALREQLVEGEIWIDLLRVRPTDYSIAKFDREGSGRYLAWITPQTGAVRAVDLGPAKKIDAAVTAARKALESAPEALRVDGEAEAEKKLRAELARLSALVLQPLLAAVGGCKRVHLSPDSSLWLIPWAALPVNEKELLIDKVTVRFSPDGRGATRGVATVPPQQPVLFADPNYDLAPGEVLQAQAAAYRRPAPVTTPIAAGASRFGKVERLPASQWEAAAIQPKLQTLAQSEPQLFAANNALEAVFKDLRRPKYLLVSTHGFVQEAGGAAANPLLNCGLLLAGCNHPPAQPTADLDDGILTGLEIVGADLRGTELVVLSACETGLGAVRDGDGVAGLRQAFQFAGAKAVVSTLWQIPDRDSALIMNDFFSGLTEGRDQADALRAAQLARMQARREKFGAAHPFYWAAWTVTGH